LACGESSPLDIIDRRLGELESGDHSPHSKKATVTRQDKYRAHLQALERSEWDTYLLAESALPGSRANLELAQATADVGDEAQLQRWLDLGPEAAPEDSATLFLPMCGAIGLGRILAEGKTGVLERLRAAANDPRWRVREAVVLGLQRLGDADVPRLLDAMRDWSGGGFLEQRAAVAALCEPRLLRQPAIAREVLAILERVTESVGIVSDRRDPSLRVLRQTLGYCWSVLVAALPNGGKPAFERLASSTDPDVRWIVRENLKKNRLRRVDAEWVNRLSGRPNA
jgi:hypothetical protein